MIKKKCPLGNFGDQLNVWLWPKLIPEVLQSEEDRGFFVGIGTLLNKSLPTGQPMAIFGSGVGYGQPPLIKDEWRIYCVRGPRTASALQLDPKLAITDAALLTRSCYQSKPADYSFEKQIAFMPHWQTPMFPWKQVCEQLGITYIDPGESVEDILSKIASSKYVLAEAMHGAILADTLRVPWISVSTRPSINVFKWLDWCESMQLEYRPVNFYYKRFSPNMAAKDSAFAPLALSLAKHRLKWAMKSAFPCLSQEKVVIQKEEELLSKLGDLRDDWKRGVFH